MKNKILFILTALFFMICANTYSQVGIGTTSPHISSMLDVTSTEKGVLTPRMTSADRIAIVTPADGLLVYDTDEGAFYYFENTIWNKLQSQVRDNYKLVKTVADLAPELANGGTTEYLLDENTLYEINGNITLAVPINVNGAQIEGRDAGEDVLVYTGASGAMFTGSDAGSIKNLTLDGGGTGTLFGINGGLLLLFQNCIVAEMASVGTISNVLIYFTNIIQYVLNSDGVTYNNINNLLLSNQSWFGGAYANSGTFETLTGSFDLVEKNSGFSDVGATAVGFDVSSNPTVNDGVLIGTVFKGAGTHVNSYTIGTYSGYNFNNNWYANCPGIPLESDFVASGNIYYNGTITTGFVQNVTNATSTFNLLGNNPNLNTTTAVNLLRASSPQNNRITYEGKKTRTFQINAALSVRGNSGTGNYYAFFIRKNGTTTLTETNTLMRVNNTSDISSNSISGTVQLAPNDFIEIWGERLTGGGTNTITVFSLNLSIK